MGAVLPGQLSRSQAHSLPFSRDQAITYPRYEHAGTNDPTIHHAPVGILSHTEHGQPSSGELLRVAALVHAISPLCSLGR